MTVYTVDDINASQQAPAGTTKIIISATATYPATSVKGGVFEGHGSTFTFNCRDTLTSVVFEESTAPRDSLPLLNIQDEAFRGCTLLTSITLPRHVSAMGNAVFRDCTGLEHVTIKSSVIGNYSTNGDHGTFKGCTNLKTVVWDISDGRKDSSYLSTDTFADTPNLEAIYMKGHNPENSNPKTFQTRGKPFGFDTNESGIFGNTPGKIYVSEASLHYDNYTSIEDGHGHSLTFGDAAPDPSWGRFPALEYNKTLEDFASDTSYSLPSSVALASSGLVGSSEVISAVGSILDDTATYTAGAAMLTAATDAMVNAAGGNAIPATPAEQLTNFKALIRQVIAKLAPNPADETSFDRATLDTLIPAIASTLPAAKTVVRAIKTGQTKNFTLADIGTESVLMVHEPTGISSSTVVLTGLPGGGSAAWKVTKDAGTGIYTVATSTDGTTFTTIQQGGADREFSAGQTFVAANGDYQCTLIFNDTLADVAPNAALVAGDPFIRAILR